MSALSPLNYSSEDRRERFYRIFKGTDPGNQVEVAEAVPGGKLWQLLAVRVNLVADATVANRVAALVLDDGNDEFARIAQNVAVTANATGRLGWYTEAGGGSTVDVTAGAWVPMPRLTLPAGYRIRTITTNLAATDNYGAPILYVCETTDRGARSEIEYELLNTLRRLLAESQYLEPEEPA